MIDKYESLQAVAGPVSRETFQRVLEFETQFRRWAPRINLAAPSALGELWQRHIIDSAQLLPLAGPFSHWLDFGSGGGFPGAVIAILSSAEKKRQVTLVESVGKKAAFLRTTLAALGVPADVKVERVENLDIPLPSPDIISARAVAGLDMLLHLAAPLAGSGTRCLFPKGRGYRLEIEESLTRWQFDLIEHRSLTSPDAVILEVSNLAARA